MVNRLLDNIKDIIYEENYIPDDAFLQAVTIHFKKCSHLTYEESSSFQFPLITKIWLIGNLNCTRKQFPQQINFTILKSQM